mgnify:CR=1 FL=1
MNQEARDKLVEAELSGVKQIRGAFSNINGKCALGVLGFGLEGYSVTELIKRYGFLTTSLVTCPFLHTSLQVASWCSNRMSGTQLVVNFNDDHGFSFLDIARKFPESLESNV